MLPTFRNLNLICIDDAGQPQALKDNFCGFIEVDPVETFLQAQKLLLRQQQTERRKPIDIVLCDVNMERHEVEHAGHVNWNVVPGDNDKMLAYGPLLVLPLLFAAPWSQFIPLSTYWSDPNVKSNGYVLTALALILTLVKRANVSTVIAEQEIDLWAKQEASHRAATDSALRKIREQIFDASLKHEVTLMGIDKTIVQLKSWLREAKRRRFQQLTVPFIQDGAPICVDILHSGGNEDHIHVSSLFADILDFRAPTDSQPVETILTELSDWKEKLPTIPMQSLEVYDIARGLLFPYLPDSKIRNYKKIHSTFCDAPLKERVADHAARGTDRYYFIIRVTMLLAFTRACYLRKYYGYDLQKTAFHFLGLPEKNPENPFKRLLGVTRHKKTLVGPPSYRHAFKHPDQYDGEADAYAAYSLNDETKPAALTQLEMRFCDTFVTEGHVHPDDEEKDDRTEWKRENYAVWMRQQYG